MPCMPLSAAFPGDRSAKEDRVNQARLLRRQAQQAAGTEGRHGSTGAHSACAMLQRWLAAQHAAEMVPSWRAARCLTALHSALSLQKPSSGVKRGELASIKANRSSLPPGSKAIPGCMMLEPSEQQKQYEAYKAQMLDKLRPTEDMVSKITSNPLLAEGEHSDAAPAAGWHHGLQLWLGHRLPCSCPRRALTYLQHSTARP